jgi:hypothetical protein
MLSIPFYPIFYIIGCAESMNRSNTVSENGIADMKDVDMNETCHSSIKKIALVRE